ncbi:hypothetical protein OUZ56_001032 [Daphnia magna]|uniref:Gustatory receptor n=1 Tax=Daphnia magna TaxID=35525 RepID=A0ABR0A1G2_9CRUS|nr:hypothetical protein OUZ56_001032 [Daphnia magna]
MDTRPHSGKELYIMRVSFLFNQSTIQQDVPLCWTPWSPISMVTSHELTGAFNAEKQKLVIRFVDSTRRDVSSFFNMSVFEQLQPFVSLCQACGLIPYAMKRNSTSGKFERFTFSVRNVSTWWFLLLLVLQISIVLVVGQLNLDMQDVLSTDRNIPTTMIVLSGISSFTFLAQIVSSRWIALNYRHLGNAVEAVQKAESLFGEKFIAEHQSSIMTRFFIGFAVVMTTTLAAMFAFGPMYAALLPKDMDVFLITAFITVLSSINVMFDCSLLLVHIFYFIIAHYIQLMSLRCKKEANDEFHATVHKRKDKIKMIRREALILDHLCRASSAINSILSIPVFLLLGIKLVTIVSSAFIYTYRFIYTITLLENGIWTYLFLFLIETIRVLVLLTAADMPVNQVRLLHERVTAMSLSGFPKTFSEKLTVMSFLIQIDEDRVHLSAAGLFKVGVHLIPALTGVFVTYMVILLQN